MKRKTRENIINKLNRRLLIALVIDLQYTQPRTVIDRCVLIVPPSRSGDSLKELHVDLDPVAWFGLFISFPSLFMPFIALILGKAVQIKLLQDPPDPRGTDGNIMISQQIHLDLPRTKVIGLPQIDDFRHNFLFRCSRTVVRAF